MKVTDYYPVFYTNDIEADVKRFEEDLGFTVIHRPTIENLEYVALENENKRRVDLVCSHFPNDSFSEGYLGMRVNVDNIEEGTAYFKGLGYSIFGELHENGPIVVALLAKDDGSYIILYSHKK